MNKFRKFGLFVLVLFLLLTLAACGGDDEKNESTSSDASAATTNTQTGANNPALPDDPLAAVTQALKNQQAAGAYRVKTTIDSAQGKMEMTAEVKPPDQLRMVTDTGGQKMEMVFVDGKGWMKMGDTWSESPMKLGDMLAQMNAMSGEMLAETASNATKVGNETINGQDTVVYSYDMDMNKSSTMKMDVKSAVKIWVRTSDGLPIKQEISGDALGVKSVSTQEIEYDPNIKIEPPVQ
ncbi:MAG: hypothetical protein U0175_31255 [Caldilineaceae bacterium]